MPCPPEIARILVQILFTGLLRIRAAGWAHDSARCAAEADHLHNLPALLVDFDHERLDYYWNVERVAFAGLRTVDDLTAFEPLWHGLAKQVRSARDREMPVR